MPKISQLPVASAVNAGDLFVIVQAGVTKQAVDSLVIAGLGLGTLAFLNSPLTPPNGGFGVISPTAHTLPVAQGASNFNFLGPLTNGQLLIGSTGADPIAATITAGAGISIGNSAGNITITATGSGAFGWVHVTGTTQQMAANTAYIPDNVGLVTLTLPATANLGDEVDVVGVGSGGWSIAQNANQIIHIGSGTSTTGVGGSVASTNRRDAVTLVCTVVNLEWTAYSVISAGLTIV